MCFSIWGLLFPLCYHSLTIILSMLPHSTSLYAITFKFSLCWHIQVLSMLSHSSSLYVTTFKFSLCYHIQVLSMPSTFIIIVWHSASQVKHFSPLYLIMLWHPPFSILSCVLVEYFQLLPILSCYDIQPHTQTSLIFKLGHATSLEIKSCSTFPASHY